MAATVKIRLNPDARRAAQSTKRLFEIIARRDAKAVVSPRPALIIFPLGDAALQAAIALVYNRLSDVILP